MSWADPDGDGLEDGMTVDDDDMQGSTPDGGLIPWSRLTDIPAVLKDFKNNPLAFIIGAVASVFIDGVNAIVTSVLAALQTILWGSQPFTTQGTWGIADIPMAAVEVLGDAVTSVGSNLDGAIAAFFTLATNAASAAGPLAPLVLAAILVITIIVAGYLLSFLKTLVVDSLNPL